MKTVAASVVALCTVAINAMSVDAFAADGTIYFNGQIVLSTEAPDHPATLVSDEIHPRRSMAEQSLPLEAEFELLDYYADYMDERGFSRTQLTLQTSAYE
ncbi:hypothetical protein MNR01_16105 [Lysobacter sp. S4-A87]|uniref:hypothetical protein n=1 Tax=Lysobacter sp. S4-A87 TaxID=2925843 RepID=UPI001F536B55|nr:hypothetical protein [Lysobacter sp. S4-A87]UNK49227.1 hypothetical protein MNR01_16105 [Lysobacter sp. S4-A87]